jgi:hypothetical protein
MESRKRSASEAFNSQFSSDDDIDSPAKKKARLVHYNEDDVIIRLTQAQKRFSWCDFENFKFPSKNLDGIDFTK